MPEEDGPHHMIDRILSTIEANSSPSWASCEVGSPHPANFVVGSVAFLKKNSKLGVLALSVMYQNPSNCQFV